MEKHSKKIGKKIFFPENNEIKFYQDFSWWQNLPSNIEFTLVSEDENFYSFIGPKFGQEGNYGNGGIAIKKTDLPKDLI